MGQSGALGKERRACWVKSDERLEVWVRSQDRGAREPQGVTGTVGRCWVRGGTGRAAGRGSCRTLVKLRITMR